jgi:hypothetical protein
MVYGLAPVTRCKDCYTTDEIVFVQNRVFRDPRGVRKISVKVNRRNLLRGS